MCARIFIIFASPVTLMAASIRPCPECSTTVRGAPVEGCWIKNPSYEMGVGEMMIGNETDMRRSARRVLDNEGNSVETWADCNNAQKRIVLYHKTYRFLYGVGRHGIRVKLPSCIVNRIKITFPANMPLHAHWITDTEDLND